MAKKDFNVEFDFDKENSFDPSENLDSDQTNGFQFDIDGNGQPLNQENYQAGEGCDQTGSDYDYTQDGYGYTQDGYGYDQTQGEYGYGEYDTQDGYDYQGQYDDQGQYAGEGQYDDQGQYGDEGQYDDQGQYGDEGQYDDRDRYEDEGQYDDQDRYEVEGQYEGEGRYDGQGESEGEDSGEEQEPSEENAEEAYESDEYEEEEPEKKVRKKISLPKVKLPRFKMPNFFGKFISLYFGPLIAEMSGMAPEEGKRRRSRSRTFKEVYLPPLVLFISLVLVISCIAGSISTAVRGKLVRDEQARKESIANAEAADRAEQENNAILQQAEMYAQEYDYDRAIEVLESYEGTAPQEVQTRKAEYVQQKSRLVEWKDPAGIPNLSFHVLIAEPERAFADPELGGKYNQNFVTTDEFQKILEALYGGNYVLVDFDSFVEVTETLDGKESFMSKPIYLPEGKKPVMLTETMVNYYDYMVDPDKDFKPDANGKGFANKLVVDGAGDIKAEIVDASGNTLVGDYDFVPILETFLKAHPDFAYQGARAILAVTGEQGIFGYRINTSVISDPKGGQAFYDEQVAGASELVAALRGKGYTLASYTYGNRNYGQDNATQIQEDMQLWSSQITPVLGPVNVMVFARESDIGNYTDTKYKALYDKGFRIFVGKSDEPFADITNAHVRQKRLMVSGVNMTFNPGMFTGLFDCGSVMNSSRPEVIKN